MSPSPGVAEPHGTLSVLLLQARRRDDPARREERASFAARTGLEAERIRPHDLLAGPPTLAEVKRHDVLMVGGSGDFYVSNGSLPAMEETLGLLAEVAEVGHPTFASCFGFQCLVAALGGEIVHDAGALEVGTYQLELTEAGRRDELFGRLPARFAAQMGRKDRASALPSGVPNLAASARTPYQAFRLPGRPIWATQFHPELTADDNRLRFRRYLDGYAAMMTPEERRAALGRFSASPHTEGLMTAFLDLVFGDGGAGDRQPF